MDKDVLIKAEHVSKKFCRSLKRSLWYGVQDIAREVLGRRNTHQALKRDEFWAVNDVSFELRRGECLGLLGRNGAGKTTLLRMLNGLIKPDDGQLTMRGRIGALIALGAGFNPLLTGRENIYVNATILSLTKREIDNRIDEIIDFADIRDFIDAPVQTYSSGMHARLGFAVASTLSPDVLLVDEVLAVGDVPFRMKCYQRIFDVRDKGTAVVIVSHSMIDIERVATKTAVMNHGSIDYYGDVTGGIRAYESQTLADSSTANHRAQAKPGPRLGETITTNDLGVPTSDFKTGDSVHVQTEIVAEHACSDLRVVVHLASARAGMLGSFASPTQNVWYSVIPPGKTIRFTINPLFLLAGTYNMHISLYGKEIKDFYDQRVPACKICVTGPDVSPFGFGPYHDVYFPHTWDASDDSVS